MSKQVEMVSSKVKSEIFLSNHYFAKILKQARCEKGLRRKELAKILKVSNSQMLQYENGRWKIPKSILLKLFTGWINKI